MWVFEILINNHFFYKWIKWIYYLRRNILSGRYTSSLLKSISLFPPRLKDKNSGSIPPTPSNFPNISSKNTIPPILSDPHSELLTSSNSGKSMLIRLSPLSAGPGRPDCKPKIPFYSLSWLTAQTTCLFRLWLRTKFPTGRSSKRRRKTTPSGWLEKLKNRWEKAKQ